MQQRSKRRIGNLVSYAILALASFIALFPLFWTLSTSIKVRNDTFTLPPKFFAFEPTWKNYAAIFDTRGFSNIYFNTILITFASTALCVFVSTLAAYSLARSKSFRSRGPLEVGLILVRAIPAIVMRCLRFMMNSFRELLSGAAPGQ